MSRSRYTLAAVLLQLAVLAAAHGSDEHSSMDMAEPQEKKPMDDNDLYNLPSYAGLGQHGNMILAHIILMVVAWFFVLPVGVVFSVARSRYALPVQFLFLVLNGLGVLFGTVYNINTPDLYENNAHHKIGWIATWIVTAQVIMSLLFTYSGRGKITETPVAAGERAAFLPLSVDNMIHHDTYPYTDHRWSGDSGQGTEQSSTLHSSNGSPLDPHQRNPFDDYQKPEPQPEPEDEDDEPAVPRRHSSPRWWRIKALDKYLSARVPNLMSAKFLRVFEVAYEVIDRTILVLGFIALVTGGVTYAGIFRGNNIFNGLAHFIKGGIFFWYGLLTLGRWMGCFADLGWAWNVKPTRSEVGQWKAAVPSAEFVESFVIFLYGSSNVFLEHLAAWGGAWTAQDLEHVSISIMFFGGGLCGMLVESKCIRRCLNAVVDTMPARTEIHPSDALALRAPPKQYGTSLNPMPALIILLLGVMMSSHHQDSMVSTMVHKQWGTMLVGFAVARFCTYILNYISPPASVYPSRPPTELVSAFCLISGGLIFMASTRDVIHYMERADLMAMFVFTVTMGFTAFIMSYEVIVLSLKGWATRKELKSAHIPVA
ncbi:putative membrane protein C3B8.06 [Exophiala dermatitidis]